MHGDVVDDIRSRLIPSLIVPPVDPFRLQPPKETLRHTIVPTVAFSAHAADDAMGLEQALEFMAGVLDTPDALLSVKGQFESG